MADKTKIEWCDATINPIRGCTRCSPACDHCYAIRTVSRLSGIFDRHMEGGETTPAVTYGDLLTRNGKDWSGKMMLDESQLLKPLHWRKGRSIFWNSLGDTFHENVPDEWIDRMFAVMALTPQHQHIVLTKRGPRMLKQLQLATCNLKVETLAALRRSVHLGISCWDQASFNAAAPILAKLKAMGWHTVVSLEPMLGTVDLHFGDNMGPEEDSGVGCGPCGRGGKWHEHWLHEDCLRGDIDLVIVGGESGPGARPMHPDWVRSIRDQCAEAGVPFFFKQWGAWVEVFDRWVKYKSSASQLKQVGLLEGGGRFWPMADLPHGPKGTHCTETDCWMRRVGKKRAGRVLDGKTHDALPWTAARE